MKLGYNITAIPIEGGNMQFWLMVMQYDEKTMQPTLYRQYQMEMSVSPEMIEAAYRPWLMHAVRTTSDSVEAMLSAEILAIFDKKAEPIEKTD